MKKTDMVPASPAQLEVAIEAGAHVAALIDILLASNAEDNPDEVNAIRAAFNSAAIKFRVTMDFTGHGTLGPVSLYALLHNGESRRISTAQFSISPTEGNTLQ